MTFSPILYNDAGQYNCSVLVDGFDEAQHSDDVVIVVNGMYACTYIATQSAGRKIKMHLIATSKMSAL